MAYDLESVKLPRLSGAMLSAMAGALETPGTRGVLLAKLLRDAGVEQLRDAVVPEAPVSQPLAPAGEPLESAADGAPCAPEGRFGLGKLVLTCCDYVAAYRQHRTSPEVVAEGLLERLARAQQADPPLNAFIAVNRTDLLRQARASAERYKAGAPLGPLDGVPLAVKDEVDMVPYPTTVGTSFLGQRPAIRDATTVARLRAAGALLVGKANMHEIGINPSGGNVHHGHVDNPYGPGHDPGGSSSGPAAATAAGLCPAALGADGGGSIRIPAAFCGLVGLKPTYGRISEHGAAPLCWSVAHLGPLAATVADASLLYSVMAGPDPDDPHTLEQPRPTAPDLTDTDVSGLRLGIYRPWFQHASDDVVRLCDAAVERLVQRGARVVELELPDLNLIRVAHTVTILAEMATSMQEHHEQLRQMASSTRVTLAAARALTARDYVKAQRVRARALAHMARCLERADLLLTPTTALTAPRIQGRRAGVAWSDLSVTVETMRFAFLANFTGHPALTVPVGYDAVGLPVGLQLMGRHWDDALLLRVGGVVERDLEPQRAQQLYLPSSLRD